MTRSVTDAAIMLDVLTGYDPKDPRTKEASSHRPSTYASFLRGGALKGKRFGVPKFVLDGTPTVRPNPKYWNSGTSPAARAAFMRTVADLEAAGAAVIFDDDILPESFAALVGKINASRYHRQGVDKFLADYGPAAYDSTKKFRGGGGN